MSEEIDYMAVTFSETPNYMIVIADSYIEDIPQNEYQLYINKNGVVIDKIMTHEEYLLVLGIIKAFAPLSNLEAAIKAVINQNNEPKP